MIVPEKVLDLLIRRYRYIGRENITFVDGRPLTDKDYEIFSSHVKKVTKQDTLLHINTWKRVFRKILDKNNNPCNISERTCQVIAEYLDCKSWSELIETLDQIEENLGKKTGQASQIVKVATQTDLTLQGLKYEDKIEISYIPDRVLCLAFQRKDFGGYVFRVVSTKNVTSIQQGDIICIPKIRLGYPLMHCTLHRNQEFVGDYNSAQDHAVQNVRVVERANLYK